MYRGLRRLQPRPYLSLWDQAQLLAQTLQGTLYMFHWLVIMPCVTARMAVRPKRLKWVKTVHGGASEESASTAI
jgi:1,2-diacylglycerol 3-beta-glucosyltransferase